jgi:oxygen-dependent protoporphyrinogen oxidase
MEQGSLLKGLLKKEKFQGPFMFGFQRGVKSVIQRLQEKTPIPFQLNEEVLALVPEQDGFKVQTNKNTYRADYVFSALPAPVIGKLLIPQLTQMSLQGATIVNLGYRKQLLRKKGFGYLVSSKEKEEVMGVIFDSNAFPQHNRFQHETRLTVKLKQTNMPDKEARVLALQAMERHLGIAEQPDIPMVYQAKDVFPQFFIGHEKRMKDLEAELAKKYPRLRLAGNYLYGVGVSDCVARARSVAKSFLSEAESWSRSSGVCSAVVEK